MPTMSMGDLAQIQPEEDFEAFEKIVNTIHRYYPKGWENWRVVEYSFEDLFGSEPSAILDGKLRFGLPTTDLVRAFHPTIKDLPERLYRQIRKTVLAWPLGRALVYSPHSMVEKIHAPSYSDFMKVITELRTDGKLTNRERTCRILQGDISDRNEVSPPSSTPKRRGGGKHQGYQKDPEKRAAKNSWQPCFNSKKNCSTN